MEQPGVLQKRDCWICFNNENNISLTKLNREKLLKNCKTYLDTFIIIESFENESPLSCCNYCYESVRQLTNLEEQVRKLQKEILDFSLLYSKTVAERRSLVGNKKDRNQNRFIPQIGKCFKMQNNPDCDSIVVLENAIANTEVNEIVSNESQSDSQTGKENLCTYSLSDTEDTDGIENVTEDEYENVVHSNDEIDVKYSFNETYSKVVDVDIADKEVLPNQRLKLSTTNVQDVQKKKTMSLSDLIKSVKMPVIHLERYLPERSKTSPIVVDGAGEENPKYENALEDSTEPNNCPETLSKVLPFKCREITCSKSFKSKYYLVRHERNHSGEKPYKCHLCEKAFSRSSNLRAHKMIHSGRTEMRPYKCSFCEKSFKSSSNMHAHEKIHSAKTLYNCSFCDKSFKTSSNLWAHERIHSAKTLYKCSLCEKSFRHRGSLNIHERVHTGERPFKCSFCSKSFGQSSNLKRHEKSHTTDRPHKCSFCAKTFHRSTTVKTHEMIHTGERPYKCSHCENTFTQSSDLKIHYNRMHQNEEGNEEFILPN